MIGFVRDLQPEMSSQSAIRLRDAQEEDFHEITEIFNDVMRNSMSLYQEEEVTVENRLQYFHDRLSAGFPFIVAVESGIDGKEEVIGYATYGSFRSSYGYRYTVEHSIYVRKDQRGKRIGNTLLNRLLEIAKDRGVHVIVGCIDSSNEVSIKMHEKFGFSEVGRMPEVGNKKGQWLTLVLVQKILSE